MILKKSAVRSLELFLIAACAGIVQVSSSPARSGAGQPVVITVRVDQPGAQINPAMWGVFFEDINFGADGGLYAEMVKNRSFEFPEPLLGWSRIISNVARGEVTVLANDPFRETNLHYVRINSKAAAPLGITNEGFRGMGVRAGDAYDFSAQIRGTDGAPKVTVGIVGSDGFTLAEARLSGISPSWSKITATLHPKETDSQARLTIFVEGTGTVDFDMPAENLEEPARRSARRHGADAGGFKTGLPALSRRLHRRRPRSGATLPVEKHHRAGRRPQAAAQSLEQ